MISVVLPTYNGAQYVSQSIESILWQTYTDWELIVVDDCSTDATGEIIEEYAQKDNRIRVVHNRQNKKLPASLNIGFQKAKGEYFSWTSDDNAYAPTAFEQLLRNLQSQKADFVFSDYAMIDPDDYILFDVKTGPVEELLIKNIIGACFLYKRQIHDQLKGYDEKKFLVEDYDFWLRVYKKYKMYHIDEILYYYRIHAKSLSAERKEEISKAVRELLNENI